MREAAIVDIPAGQINQRYVIVRLAQGYVFCTRDYWTHDEIAREVIGQYLPGEERSRYGLGRGGGKIAINPKNRSIKVYGTSGEYGAAPEQIIQEVLGSYITQHGYTLNIEIESYDVYESVREICENELSSLECWTPEFFEKLKEDAKKSY